MSHDKEILSSDIFFPDDDSGSSRSVRPAAKPPRSRIGRAVVWTIIGALLIMLGLEVSGWYFQRESIARLKEIGRGQAEGQRISPDTVRQAMAGWPLESSRDANRRKMIVFTWPTVVQKRHVRMVLARDGSVYTLDATADPEDDVVQPFVYADSGGVKLPEYREPVPIEQPRFTSKELIAELNQAFETPARRLPAGVLVFPVTGADNKITDEGLGLAMIANFSATYTPRRRLATDPRRVLDTLLAANYSSAGTESTDSRIQIVVRDIEPTRYVLPQLITTPEGFQLRHAVHALTDGTPVRTFEHTLAAGDLPRVPGLIVQDVLESSHVELTDAEREFIGRPQFKTQDEIRDLSYWMAGQRMRGNRSIPFAPLADRSSNCSAAWEFRLGRSTSSQTDLPQAPEVVECGAIQRQLATSFMVGRSSVNAFRELLKLAPDQRQDALFFRTLFNLAQKQDDDALDDAVMEVLLAIWEREDRSYGAHLQRGEALVEWAWKARGGGWSSEVSRKGWQLFEQRLRRAEREYEDALAVNPQGWLAHGSLIKTAKGLGRPYSSVRSHRRKAAELCPDSWYAYQNEFDYLQKRWHGTEDQLLALARECLETRQWNAKIPQMTPAILFEVAFDYQNNALDFKWFRQPPYYSLVHDYYRYAQEQPDRAIQRDALNYAAIRLAGGGRYRDAAPLFDRLDPEWDEPQTVPGTNGPVRAKGEYMEEHFKAEWSYFHSRDAVRAHVGEPAPNGLSTIRLALAHARLDEAEQLLSATTPADDVESRELNRCRKALALGRRLHAEGSVELSALDMLQVCAEFHRLQCTPLDAAPQWSVAGDALVWTYNGYAAESKAAHRGNLFFPVGLLHGTISATMDFDGEMHRVEVIAHTQTERNRLHLYYDPQQSQITLERSGRQAEFLKRAITVPIEFRMQYGSRTDTISPMPDLSWDAVVRDDIPSTFGITTWAGNAPAKLSLKRIRIEKRS